MTHQPFNVIARSPYDEAIQASLLPWIASQELTMTWRGLRKTLNVIARSACDDAIRGRPCGPGLPRRSEKKQRVMALIFPSFLFAFQVALATDCRRVGWAKARPCAVPTVQPTIHMLQRFGGHGAKSAFCPPLATSFVARPVSFNWASWQRPIRRCMENYRNVANRRCAAFTSVVPEPATIFSNTGCSKALPRSGCPWLAYRVARSLALRSSNAHAP
jgi:hypothetical protein